MKISQHDQRWLTSAQRSLLSFVLMVTFSAARMHSQSVTASLDIGTSPQAIAADTLTDRIYVVGNGTSSNVTVINAATDATLATVTDSNALGSVAIAVNPVTNKVYVANYQSNNVTVIAGISYSTTVSDPHAKA